MCGSLNTHKSASYELQCLDFLTKSRTKKSVYQLYLKIRGLILAYADKKLIKPITLTSTNLAYSPSKAMSTNSIKMKPDLLDTEIYLRDIFLTREEYKEVAGKVKSSFPLKLQKWVEEQEKKLTEKRKHVRTANLQKESDPYLVINDHLFKTELTAGDAICWRILKWFIEENESDDDYLKGKAKDTNPGKQAIVDEILELQNKSRGKRLDLMLLLAFLKSKDPLFRDAKTRVIENKDKLQLFKNLVTDPVQVKRMKDCVGKGGDGLFDNKKGDSKIMVNLYRKATEKLD
jgi:hypothetical protein